MIHNLLISLLVGAAFARASYPILPESKVNRDLFPLSRQQRACTTAPFQSSISGYVQISTFGVTVTRGATATINFSAKISGISAVVLASSDAAYQRVLSRDLKATYMRRKRTFKGGLNIPMIMDVGADLRWRRVNGKNVRKSAVSKKMFSKRLCVVSKILGRVKERGVLIRGSRRVTGTSFIPKTVYGYVKVAKVKTHEGKTITIVSTDPKDYFAATKDGTVIARGVKGVEVTQM